MPLMKIDMIKGRTPAEIQKILDISYVVMLKNFQAPRRDRYQIVTQHEPTEMQILDTGLGITRTTAVLIFSLTTRPRTQAQKLAFYTDLVGQLYQQVGIRKADVMINLLNYSHLAKPTV